MEERSSSVRTTPWRRGILLTGQQYGGEEFYRKETPWGREEFYCQDNTLEERNSTEMTTPWEKGNSTVRTSPWRRGILLQGKHHGGEEFY
jgi:hypothetical protein